MPKSEIIGRREGEEGGAEGVLNFVVGFLGTVDRGLIDAGLAGRLEAEEITFLSPGLGFLSVLVLFHLEEKSTVLT